MTNIEQALHRPDGISLPVPLENNLWRWSWRQSRRYVAKLPVRPIEPLVAGDAAVGRAMLQGQFSMAGTSITAAPARLFDMAGRSQEWRDAVLGLSFLPHLAATPQHLASLTARAAIMAWQSQGTRSLTSRQAAEALIALSAYAGFLLQDAGVEFHASFQRIIDRLCRRMQLGFIESAETALGKAVALSHAAVAFQFSKQVREEALAQTSHLLAKVVLPDGGHVSREPRQLVQLALQLLPLQHALRTNRLAVPAPLNAALERLLPMLRLLSHGDGGLAALHDGGLARHGEIQAILAADTSCGRPLALAPYSGFARLAFHDGVLLADTGSGGPCNSPLAFEFSDAGQRLIVSCGRPAANRHPWHAALASATAHSSWDMPPDYAGLRPVVKAEALSSPQGGLLQASLLARGWRKQATHQRKLFLAATGTDLRGEDHVRLQGVSGAGASCLRFHLHPSVSIEKAPHPNCVLLALPDGKAWMFSQAGGAITIEDSIYCDAGSAPQASQQIVVRSAQQDGLNVQWSLIRKSAARTSP